MADQGQKTEQPTDRRIEKAREEGNFAVSRDFVAALQFSAFVALAATFSDEWLAGVRNLARAILRSGFQRDVDVNLVVHLFREVLFPATLPLLALGLLLMTITVGVQLATTKMGFSLKKLQPDIQRINPAKKLKGIPRQNVPQFLQALVLMPLFLTAVYVVVTDELNTFLRLPLVGVEVGLAQIGLSIKDLLWKAAALFLVVGCIDLYRQRRRYIKDLRMSKQEIRDEHKEVEGNPHTKARIRRLQRDLVRRQMMKDVATASAVVVNPTHYAVAIRYEIEGMGAPRVVAKGKNYLAKRIREKAKEHEIPIVENPPLAQALYKSAEVGQEIPVHLYRAVAEVLAYIYRIMDGRLPGTAAAKG
jgi:flagellar biosynthetic protein FlhB